MKVALALGGGGARGIAHIGVLKFCEEVGFKPDIICGSSIGAIVGARYAQVLSWKVVWDDVNRALESESFKRAGVESTDEEKGNPFQEFMKVISRGIVCTRALSSLSLVSERTYLEAISEFIPNDALIEETRVTFAAVAVDLLSGREVVLTKGSVVKAVAASAAIPGVFPPVQWGDMLLVDGGWVDVLPAMAARMLGADFVIGVWVGKRVESLEPVKNAFDVVYRADEVTRHYLNWMRRDECDAIIDPPVGDYMWNQFNAKEELFEKGYEAAKRCWEAVERAMMRARLMGFLKRPVGRVDIFNPIVV